MIGTGFGVEDEGATQQQLTSVSTQQLQSGGGGAARPFKSVWADTVI